MAADSLQIKVIVDGSQVQSGMASVTTTVDAATAKIKASFGSLADAPAGIQAALLVLQNSARQSTEAVADATAAINQLGSTSSTAAADVETLDVAVDRAGKSANNARAAFMGLNSELGLKGNRALGSFIAQSQSLGPVLNTAFTGIAILGFIQLAELAADKISRLIADTFIFTQAQKDLDAQLIQDNKTIATLYEQHLQVQRGIQLIGLSQLAAAEKKRQWAIEDQASTAGSLESLRQSRDEEEKKLQTLLAQLAALEKQKSVTRIVPKVGPVENDNSGQINELKTQIDASTRAVTAFDSTLGVMQSKLVGTNDELARTNKTIAVDAMKEHERQYKEHIKTLEKYQELLQKIKDGEERLAEEQKAFGEAAAVSDAKDSTKDLGERIGAELEFQRARMSDQQQAATTEIDIEQEKVREMARLGQITTAQELQQLDALEEKKLVSETQYLNQRANVILARLLDDDAKSYAEDLKEWSKILSDKQKAEDTYAKNRQKNASTAATAEQATWNKMAQGITQVMDQAVQGIVMGTQTLGQAFGHMVDGMLAKFIEAMLQMLEQWILTHVLMLAVKKSTQQQEVLADAKSAAAAAWKAVAGIPVIGPVLAPIAAATAFAGVEAFSAAGGWDVPGNIPTSGALSLIHPSEMVLPAHIANSVRSMGSGAGGGDVHVHLGNVTALDARGVQDVLSKQSAHIGKIVQKELRRMNAI